MLGHGLSAVVNQHDQFKSFMECLGLCKNGLGGRLLSLLEDSVAALSAGVPVFVVGHEVAAPAPVAEWALPLNLAVLDLVVLANCI